MSSNGTQRQRDVDQAADSLSAFWNGVVSGAKPEPGALEPDLAATVLQLHAVPLAPGLRESRQDQIWLELIASWPVSLETRTIPPSQHRSPNGPGTRSSTRGAGSLPASPRWPVLHVATMALIVFTVLASLVTFAGLRRWSVALGPVSLPASNLPSAVISDTMLMRAPVDTLPAAARWASIDRITMPPDGEWAFDVRDGEGPLLYLVESGKLTVRADGPSTVTPGGTDQARPVAPGTEVMLEAGDQGFTPSSETSRWRNDGERPTVIIATRITTLDEGLPPSGIARQLLVYDLAFDPSIPPFLLTVRRVTLSATAELAVDAVPGLRLLYVESGQLEARDSQPAATGAAQRTSPTTTKSFRVVNGAGVTRTFPSGRIFQAAGGDPVTLVLMTITDGNPLMVTH